MIGNSFQHLTRHGQHRWHFLLAGLLVVLTYLLLSESAAAGPFPAEFDLGSLLPENGGDGTTGFVLGGADAQDLSGYSVSGLGDVNGDGIDDLIIGAYEADPNGQSDAGESYVVFGRTTGFPALFELRSLFPAAGGDGSAGFVLKGIDSEDLSGGAVSGLGDVNGDGIDDLIIGAYEAHPNWRYDAGESYVVFGRTTGFPAAFELRSLHPALGGDGSAGFFLKGVDLSDRSGISVSGLGDVNGDGIDDLIIGAYEADPNGQFEAGESYVVFGRTTGFPAALELRSLFPAGGGDGSAGFVLKGVDYADYAGWSVSGLGDVNGDGIDDLIIGAYEADPNGQSEAGESYVVFGRTTGFPAIFELRSLFPAGGGDGSAGFVLKGVDAYDGSGISVSGLGDVNGDGIDEVIIGAPWANSKGQQQAGESYVVFGRTTGFPATFELSSLFPAGGGDGSAGFVLKGVDLFDYSGWSVSGLGDVNGDGIDDLIIGAYGDGVTSYVVFGRTTGFAAVLELGSLLSENGGDGTTGFILQGSDGSDSVSGLGDVNGDGIDDLIIGARLAGQHKEGESYVVFGRVEELP